MRIACGVDTIDLAHAQMTLSDPVQLQRVLHVGDMNRHDPEHIAGRIALKEATMKTLGLPPGSWLDIHIHTELSGKPTLSISSKIASLISLDGSISHHGTMVIAFVVALFDDES